MSLKTRIIPCLDVKDGRVVKGVQFVDLIDAGDPVEAAIAYDAAGADELCFLDITASSENRETIFDVVARTAEQCFMPVTVGGGVRTVEDIRKLLLSGADKVSINTAAVNDPDFVARAADKYGDQCIVVSVDARRRQTGAVARGPAKRDFYDVLGVPRAADETTLKNSYRKLAMQFSPDRTLGNAELEQKFKEINEAYDMLRFDLQRPTSSPSEWEIFTHGGRTPTGLDAVEFAVRSVERGAGELLVTSMDRDGTKSGFDLELTRAIADAVNVPVVASGGVGSLDDLVNGVKLGHASAVLAASIFHFGTFTVSEAKAYLAQHGIPMRMD